ncbi:MAG: hypothetical protein QM493_04200 [Sulfurovum sp.]
MNLDDISKYLPKYLSDKNQRELFQQLKDFPDNYHKIFATITNFDNGIIQSDVVENIPFIQLPNTEIKKAKVLVLSNSCDIEPDNKRHIPPSVSYIPIISLKKLEVLLNTHNKSQEQILNIINDIKKQKITSMFYLPKGVNLDEECVALFDKTSHCKRDDFFHLAQENNRKKLISFGNYGFYIFLIKLSIHFTRIHEGIDRDK